MHLFSIIIFLVLILFGCQSQSNDLKTDIHFDSLSSDIEVNPDYQIINKDNLFEIELPVYMTEFPELHDSNEVEYAFIDNSTSNVKELYVLAMYDTKNEIKEMNLSVEFTTMSFANTFFESVIKSYDSYTMITEEAGKEDINGSIGVIYEFEASLGDVKNYVCLAVIEGENAYYEILTWTLIEQKEEYRKPMKKLIYSFKEL